MIYHLKATLTGFSILENIQFILLKESIFVSIGTIKNVQRPTIIENEFYLTYGKVHSKSKFTANPNNPAINV